MNNISRIISEIAALAQQGARFVSVDYRSKGSGELARHTFLIGADYGKILRRSMEQLTKKLPTLSGIDEQAARELIASYSKSILHHDTGTRNEDYTKANTYVHVCPGLKIHKEDNSFELCGLSVAKKVLEPGVYKQVNSKPLTLAKERLAKDLPISKFRTLALDAGALQSISVSKKKISL